MSPVDLLDPAPRIPPSPNERRGVFLVAAILFGLFALEFFDEMGPRKMGLLFAILAWGPLIAIHEFGHALAARSVGWRVSEIVIGYGRELVHLRCGETLIRIKAAPVEGYILPTPGDLRYPRLKSAWIYAAGPGAELLILLGLWFASGGKLFTLSEDLVIIAMQGTAVAIGIGLFFTLVPLPFNDAASDGLGIILSMVTPVEQFRAQLLHPEIHRAERQLILEQPEAAIEILEAAIKRHGPVARLLAYRAVAEAMRGDLTTSDATLKEAQSSAGKDDVASIEICRAWEMLLRNDPGLNLYTAQAARKAVAVAPYSVLPRCLLGRALFEQGDYREAYIELMQAYKRASVSEEEGLCLGYLALTTYKSGPSERNPLILPDAPLRFGRAFLGSLAGAALRERVERELGQKSGPPTA